VHNASAVPGPGQGGRSIAADVAAGAKAGVRSTPTLFINGRTVEGALDRDLYDYVLAMERHG
jgi:protein-disulfide isomerase